MTSAFKGDGIQVVKQVCKLSNNCVLSRFELELELGFRAVAAAASGGASGLSLAPASGLAPALPLPTAALSLPPCVSPAASSSTFAIGISRRRMGSYRDILADPLLAHCRLARCCTP